MNETIQIDGKCVPEFSGAIECCRVVVIPGKLINILTSPPDLDNFVRITQNEDGTSIIEGKGSSYERYIETLKEFSNPT